MSGSRYVGLYPRAWRERYGEELQDVLERDRLGFHAQVDLVRGAVDAHLHPMTPSRLPVLAAVTASALAVAHSIALAAQPVATDWPGYQEEALPLIIGSVAAGLPAIVGLWLRLGDGDGALGRLGVVLALVGHVAWLAALIAALARVAYGPLTGAVAVLAMTGMALLGVALVGRGRLVLGVLVAGVGLAGVAPPAWGWAALAAAWTGVAILLVLEPPRPGIDLGGARHA
jgi:hypothetical protein